MLSENFSSFGVKLNEIWSQTPRPFESGRARQAGNRANSSVGLFTNGFRCRLSQLCFRHSFVRPYLWCFMVLASTTLC